MTSPSATTGATPAPVYRCTSCGREFTASNYITFGKWLSHLSDASGKSAALCRGGSLEPIGEVKAVSHRLPIENRLASVIGVRPSATGPAAPRFLVGAEVASGTGKRGVVVEVYQGDRRVRLPDGNREWFAADQLVALRPKAARTGWRRPRAAHATRSTP